MFTFLINQIDRDLKKPGQKTSLIKIKQELVILNGLLDNTGYNIILEKLAAIENNKASKKYQADLDLIKNVLQLFAKSEYKKIYELLSKLQINKSTDTTLLSDEVVSHLANRMISCSNEDKVIILKTFSEVKNSSGSNFIEILKRKKIDSLLINYLQVTVTKSFANENSRNNLKALLALTGLVQQYFKVDLNEVRIGLENLLDLCKFNDKQTHTTTSNSSGSERFFNTKALQRKSVDSDDWAENFVDEIIRDGRNPIVELIEQKGGILNALYSLNQIYEKCDREQVKYCMTDTVLKSIVAEIEQKHNTSMYTETVLRSMKDIWQKRYDDMEQLFTPYEVQVFT